MGEVHLCFQRFRYRLVFAELSTVIQVGSLTAATCHDLQQPL